MSYTSSDPENYNRDPDTSSLASTSTAASQLSKSNKKPWSKLKSSIKSIKRRMSTGSKPNFAEPTESSERKKSKKTKKVKESSSAGDAKPSTSEDKPREKSPSKGAKNLIKKLSVESISTPFVGYQPSSVSPSRSYAKAVSKSSGSTSESNLSFSDIDSPRKVSTLDKTTKFSFPTQESPDSGRVSQAMDDSRPPSQVTEEGYVSGTQRDVSDKSVDSDSAPGDRSAAKEVPFESLVSKTAQFAQSLALPTEEKPNSTVSTATFIKTESAVNKSEPSIAIKNTSQSIAEVKKNENDKQNSAYKIQKLTMDEVNPISTGSKSDSKQKEEKIKSDTKFGVDEIEGKNKPKPNIIGKKDAASEKENSTVATASFIKAETVVKNTEPSSAIRNTSTISAKPADVKKSENDKISSASKIQNLTTDEVKPVLSGKKSDSKEKEDKFKSGISEIEGKNKAKPNIVGKKDVVTADFIKAEQSGTTKNNTSEKLSSEKGISGKDKPVENEKKPEVTVGENKTEPSASVIEEQSKISTSRDKTPEGKSVMEEKSDTSAKKTPELYTKTNDQREDKPAASEKPKVIDGKTKSVDTSEEKSKIKSIGEAPEEKSVKEKKSDTSDKKATPELHAETVDQKVDKKADVSKKEETQEPPISDKLKGSTSKSTASAGVSPLDGMGPSSPKDPNSAQMSVEEKLEAFLSAEGWSGTIKDVANKPSPDVNQQPDKRECLYKILVIGELGTGKTSIIKRYVHQFFSQHYRATIGVDFALKVLNWDPSTIIRLQLWDIAGQERFGNMTRVYYKEAVGAFIVFDVTRSATFDAVLKWKQDLDSKVQLADGSPIPCVLLANKCDQQKEGIVNTPAKMDEYCKENNFSAWFETSAKEDINIDDAAKSLVTQILQNDKLSQNGRDSMKEGKFPLDGKSEEESRSCAC